MEIEGLLKNAYLDIDKRDKLIYLKPMSEISVLGLNVLNESLGSFERQGQISEIIASAIMQYLNLPFKENIKIDVSSVNDYVNCVFINYYEETSDSKISANIYNIDEDKNMYINIYISKFLKNTFSKKDIENKIATVVSHELMHGNIFLKRYQASKPIDDVPDYYEPALKMYEDFGQDNIFGLFGYALYSTYYHERQAFISMTNTYVKGRIGDRKNISTNELTSIIKDTTAYTVYSTDLETSNILLNDKGIRKMLINQCEKYGIEFDENTLVNKLNWIKKMSEYTIKKIFKNAILALE